MNPIAHATGHFGSKGSRGRQERLSLDHGSVNKNESSGKKQRNSSHAGGGAGSPADADLHRDGGPASG